MTCVFAQLAQASDPARPDAESLRTVLERYHEDAAEVCAEHDGVVVESRSDAVLAVFGAPVAHEDAAQRALRSAAELVARTRELPLGLRARCGVATGEVVASARRGTTSVFGESVGAAERLGRAAALEEIRIDAPTWGIVRHAARATALGERGFRLEGFDPDAPAIRRRLDRPLIGRDDEMRRLRDAYARCEATSTAHVVALVGEPGIGKSRLATELAVVLGDRATVLAGRCPAHGRGMTYWPLRSIVEQVTGDRPIDERRRLAGRSAVGRAPGGGRRRVARGRSRRGHGVGLPARDRGTRPAATARARARRRAPGRARARGAARRHRRAGARRARARRRGGAARRARRAPSRWETRFGGGDCLIELGPLSRAAVAELLDAIERRKPGPGRARADRRGGRRQPALPRAARRLARRARRTGGAASTRAARAARLPPGPARGDGALGAGAGLGRGGRVRDARGARAGRRRLASRARAGLRAPGHARPARARRRRHDPLPPRPRARGRLRLAGEGGAGPAARAPRRVAGAPRRRAAGGRCGHRPAPRGGLPLRAGGHRRHARAPGVRGGPPARRGGARGALTRRPHRGDRLPRACRRAARAPIAPRASSSYPPWSRR